MSQKQKKAVSTDIKKETNHCKTEQDDFIMEDTTMTLSQYFAFTVCMVVVFYMAFCYQDMAKDIERSSFSLPDQCGELDNKQNHTNFNFGLKSLKLLGDVDTPTAVQVDEEDLEDPSSWILNGDTLRKVGRDYWHIAVDTNMSGISGAMLQEWFETVNCSSMYQWWHPKDHIYGVWLDYKEYEASSDLVARQGKIHRVKEKIGGEMNRLDIIFQDPCVDKGCESLKSQGVELILSGRVHAHLALLGRVYAGYFIHTLRVHDSGSTLHSRFTMGKDVQCLDFRDSWGCFFFEKFQWIIKKVMLSEKSAKAIFRHCKEEMFTLGRLLARINKIPAA